MAVTLATTAVGTTTHASDEASVIRRYCGGIDAYVDSHKNAFTELQQDRDPTGDRTGSWRVLPKAAAEADLDYDAAARYWRRNGKVVFVVLTLTSGSGDWVLFVSNYYRPDGTLAKLESQLNTHWGDVTVNRDWLYARDSSVVRFQASYYKLGTSQRTRLPADFEESIPVPLYQTVDDLPFRGLLRH